MVKALRRPSGFRGFLVIWSGQVVSSIGTRMTNFAVALWAWNETRSALIIAMLLFSSYAATVVCSPLAGALVDRLPRRLTIVLSDLGSAVATAVLLSTLLLVHHPPIWVVFFVNATTGAFLAFQYPAYAAAIAVMMRKGNYPRANALMAMVRSVPAVFAPAAAGVLLAVANLQLILVVDTLSYLLAIGTVFLVAVPGDRESSGTPLSHVWRESLFGFRYLLRRPALMQMEAVLFTTGALAAIGWTLLNPLVLARAHSAAQAGVVQSVGAIGGVAGGIVMGMIPHNGRKMWRILVGIVALGLLGRVLFGIGDSAIVWSVSLFCAWACLPFINGYAQAVWQEKIEKPLQGRVFAAQQSVEELAVPIGLGVAGLLADKVFEPGMRDGGPLVPVFGSLVGTGPGAGMAVVFVLSGLLCALVGLVGFALPSVRGLESRLPDAETGTETGTETGNGTGTGTADAAAAEAAVEPPVEATAETLAGKTA